MRLICFSIFGSDRTYSAGAVANARLAPVVYPGWTCRFYVGEFVDRDDRAQLLAAPDTEVVDMPGPYDPFDWSGLFWRYLPLVERSADAYLFRDADSRLSVREAAAVAEWQESNRRFHIMRDHPAHWVEILAGMWGCTREGAEWIRPLFPNPLWNSQPYVDQWWLRDVVYPIACKSMLVHDSYGRIPGEDCRPFPTERKPPWEFVAQGFNADGTLRVPADALASLD